MLGIRELFTLFDRFSVRPEPEKLATGTNGSLSQRLPFSSCIVDY